MGHWGNPAAARDEAPARKVDFEDLVYLEGVSWRVIEHDANGLVFEVVNDAPGAPTTTVSKLETYRWVAAPSGSRPVFEALDAHWELQWERQVDGPLGLEDERRGITVPLDFTLPRGYVVGDFRGVGLLSVRVGVALAVYTRDGGYENGTAVLRRGRFRLSFEGGRISEAPPREDLATRDPYLMEMAEALFLNAKQLPEVLREVRGLTDSHPAVAWNRQLADSADRGPIAMLKAVEEGWHRIDREALEAAGVDAAEWNPDRLLVTIGNDVVPAVIEQDGGKLSSVELWIPRRDKPGAAFVPVWIMEGDRRNASPSLEAPGRGASVQSPGIPRLSHVFFEPNRWSETYPGLVGTSRWATATASPGGDLRVRFDAPGLASQEDATLTVWLGGNRPTFSAQSRVYLNGEILEWMSEKDLDDGDSRNVLDVSGNGVRETLYELPAGLLRESGNLLVATFDSGPTNVPQEELVLSRLRVDYVAANPLPVNRVVEISAEEHDGRLQADGGILDVTNPLKPRWLADGETVETGQRIAAVNERSTLSVAGIEAVKYRELLAPDEGADMIIITAEVLREAAEEYAAWRRSDQRRVTLLTVEEIQRAFSHGWTTDEALRTALSQAFAAWPGARVSQVLLIGEASEYWWMLDHPRDDVAPNQVPVHGYANPDMLIRGDDGHAIVAGAGRISDLEIGRIPAKTPEEVRAVLARTQEYETSAPEGLWRDRHLIVSDDEEEFTRAAERLVIGAMFPRTEARRLYLHEFPYEDYFRIFQRKRSIAATQSLIEALDEGALTATYIGHGGPNLWSPRRLLHMRDIPQLTNATRRPLLIAGSCDTAWLDFPVAPVSRSFAETFVMAEGGGAIASYAPVYGAVSHEHDFLLRAFYNAMLDHPDWEVGRLTLASKLGYILYRQDASMPAQYVLLGDPALRLAQPARNDVELQVEAVDLFARCVPSIQVRGQLKSDAGAQGQVWIEDRAGRPVIAEQAIRPRDGRFAAALTLGEPLDEGDYALVVRFVDTGGSVHRAHHRLRVRTIPATVEWYTANATEEGDRARLDVRADLSPEPISAKVVMEIHHAAAGQETLLATLPITPGREGAWGNYAPLQDGINVFTARVVANPDGPNRHVLAEATREISRPSAELPHLDLVPDSVTVDPNPVENATTITLRLANLTDESLKQVGAELMILEGDGERRLGQYPRGFSAAPHGSVPLAWRATELLPAGDHRARLRMVSFVGETNGEDDSKLVTSQRDFVLHVPPAPRLEIVPDSVSADGANGFRGETVFVSARVRNAGTEPVQGGVVRLFLGLPEDGGVPAPSAVGESEVPLAGELAPGEERTVQLRWDPRPGSPANTQLVAIAGTSSRPANLTDPAARGMVQVKQRELPNLAVLRDQMFLSRELVRPGDVLSMQVPVVNDTAEDFDFPFLIEVRAQGPMVDDVVILTHQMPGLAAGERIELPITWRADGKRTRLYAVVNEEREFGEARGDDNDGRLDIAYVLPESNLRTEANAWTFAADRHLGTHANTMVDPGDAITIARRPTGGWSTTFDNSMVADQEIPLHAPPSTNRDGRMALADGALYWTINETAEPVRLRIPLPEGRETDVVDVYLTQLGPGYVHIDQSNGYRLRFGDGKWIANPNRREVEVYFGRTVGVDGVLEMEIAPDGEQTWNTISQVRLVPVQGTYTSPIYEMERFPGGTFAPRFDAPPDAKVRFEVRTAGEASLEPRFTQWGELRPGLRLPPDGNIRMLQWRVTLGAGRDGNPRVNDAAFEFAP